MNTESPHPRVTARTESARHDEHPAAEPATPRPELPLAAWEATLDTVHMLTQIVGKVTLALSPFVNQWWNVALYLSHARFSGRPATPPAAWPRFMQIAERQENFACGFWPGNVTASGVTLGEPAFSASLYPEPPGLGEARIRPDAATLDFFRSSYEVAATLAGWDRAALEQTPPVGADG